MNAKELKKYNRSRRQYHKLLARQFGRAVINHILYKTQGIQRCYKLEANAAEEVEQELTIAVMKATQTCRPSTTAQKNTYLVGAINKHAAHLGRKHAGLPITEHYDSGFDIQEAGTLYRTSQENAHRLYNQNDNLVPAPTPKTEKARMRRKRIRAKECPKIKSSIVSFGSELAQHTKGKPGHSCDIELKMDIKVTLRNMSPCQQTIVALLSAGYTQQEIATKLKKGQSQVSRDIRWIRKKFLEFKK